MTEANLEDVYELSPMQQGILFHTLYDREGDLYFKQCIVTFSGKLDPERFARAWQRVAARHAILRTSFHWEGLEKPVQVVHGEVDVPFQSLDWSDLPEPVRSSRFDAFLRDDRRRSFELASAPLFRIAVVRRGEDLYDCLLSLQHLLLDRWSRFLVLREVFTDYASGTEGASPPAARPYGDYIAWLQGRDRDHAEAFWRRTLAGFTTPTPLAASGRNPTVGAVACEEVRLSAQETENLQSFARSNRLTLNTLVTGAWAILVSRYSGEEDVLFGATVAGRPSSLANVDAMVGLFINSLPVRVRVPPEEGVLPWLQRLQTSLVELRQYEHSALIDIQEWSDVPRGVPLFESLVVFENVGGDSDSLSVAGPLEVLGVRSLGGATNYPLTLLASPGPVLSLSLEYRSGLFDPATVRRMLNLLKLLLEGIVADPHRRLSRLPLMTSSERHQVLVLWNQTDTDYPTREPVYRLFTERAERTPDAPAVEWEGRRLTYGELHRRSNQVARHLRAMGVGPEVPVGLCLERSPEMVVALLGILKAGGAYLPLDPTYPEGRRAFMMQDSGAVVLLTRRGTAIAEDRPFRAVFLEECSEAIDRESGENLDGGTSPSSLAYIIYTSGSTGPPRGVEIEHASLTNYVLFAVERFRLRTEDRVLQFASLSFDAAAEEIFATLTAGATLVLRSEEMIATAGAFLARCHELSITVLGLPTAYWHELVGAASEQRIALPDSLRMMIVGGESALPERFRQWREMAGSRVQFLNGYGPTEATIAATFWEPAPNGDVALRTVPIGRPIANVRAYVLDGTEQPVPPGFSGELYVGGAGVARGYRDRPELTNDRFIADPFENVPGSRLYRTGDRARWLEDGNLEYLGRIDDQVKVRGFRVEPGEVEAALREIPEVCDAVVVGRDGALVAYVVCDARHPADAAKWRTILRARLPEHLVPTAYVRLERLPLNPSGKVDRRALPAPVEDPRDGRPFVPPRTPVEEALASIWREILKRERVGVEDDFFDLGGHSILATRLVSRIAESFKVRVALREVFERPTLGALALSIAGAMASEEAPDHMLRMLAEVQRLSDAEARDRLVLESGAGRDGW